MIIYEPGGSWIGVVLTYGGTIWPQIGTQFTLWCLFSLIAYFVVERTHVGLGKEVHSILASTMSFLLIFRANQSYARYWQGRTSVAMFFSTIRDFTMMSILHIHGGAATMAWLTGNIDLKEKTREDKYDVRAREFRINIVRLSVAYGVMLKLYTRIALDGYCFGAISCETKWLIDWDRLRLRQLLKDDEFKAADACLGILEDPSDTSLDGLAAQFRDRIDIEVPDDWPDDFEVSLRPGARAHSAVLYYLRELLILNVNDFVNTVPWGIKERFVPNLSRVLSDTQEHFDMIAQIISTPVALPYACLCKTLVLIYMVCSPMTVDHTLGFFGGYVVPVFLVLALLGIDAISTELENPFGDDANDLDILEFIHSLEKEALEFLHMSGDFKAIQSFQWRRMPFFITEHTCKPITHHLVFGEFATAEVAPSGTVTPASSHRGSDRGYGRQSSLIRSQSMSDASSRG